MHIADVQADPEYTLAADARNCRGYRTMLGVPLLREGCSDRRDSVCARSTCGRSPTSRSSCSTTFADQAVIAIENVRLFDEVQARTRELTESLEQQTATSEVLQVISSSPGELEPVFQAMLENATRICEAKFGSLCLFEGDAFRARLRCTTRRRRLSKRLQREPGSSASRRRPLEPRCANASRSSTSPIISCGTSLGRADRQTRGGAVARSSSCRCSRKTS